MFQYILRKGVSNNDLQKRVIERSVETTVL